MKDPTADFTYLFRTPPSMAEGVAAGVRQNLSAVETIYSRALAQAQELERSKHLTASGKRAKAHELAEQVDAELRKLEDGWKGYEDNARQLESELNTRRRQRHRQAHRSTGPSRGPRPCSKARPART